MAVRVQAIVRQLVKYHSGQCHSGQASLICLINSVLTKPDPFIAGDWDFIQETVDRGQLTGNGRYIEEVERIIGRRIEHRRQRRPKKDKDG